MSSGPEPPDVDWTSEDDEPIDWNEKEHFVRPEELDEAVAGVVGQEDLVRKLKSAFSQYTLYLDEPDVQRPIVLVYGPSGSGKTFTVEALGRACDLPFTPVSSASVSPPSYKGLTLRDLLIQHWKNYDTDEGVLFLDEIDKWCRGSIANGTPDSETLSNGIRTQAEVLRYVEMESIRFIDEARDDEDIEKITFETRNLFWIMAGAFVGLDKVIKKRLQNVHFPEEDVWLHAQPADFIAYGMVPELANRITTWAWVKPLTRQQIMEILRTQELPKWIRRFEALDCELDLDAGALGMCANWAYEAKTGARGAAAIMRRAMDDIFYEASKLHKDYVRVDANTVRSGRLEVEIASAAS